MKQDTSPNMDAPAQGKKYFRGLEEVRDPQLVERVAQNEFQQKLPTEFLSDELGLKETKTSRRDFLKYMGFTTAAATLAACEAPVSKAVPYVMAPEEIIPGLANYYASTYFDGHDFASVLVKTREGRPIKIENNYAAGFNGAGNARVHASILNLYDSQRLQKPRINGKDSDWASLDAQLTKDLKQAQAQGKDIVFLTAAEISPSALSLIGKFEEQYPNFRHVTYEAQSYSGLLNAVELLTGKRALPVYAFQKARVTASFGADFLQEIGGQNVNADYAKTRVPGKDMGRHWQFEANLSLTGSNADKRVKMKSSEMGPALIALYNALAKKMGQVTLPGGKTAYQTQIEQLATELAGAQGKSLVIAGANDQNIQMIVLGINQMLGNIDQTVELSRRSYLRQADDAAVHQLVRDMKSGKVGALVMHQVNPAYTLPASLEFAEALKKVSATVSVSSYPDETAQLCKYVAAKHFYLESWGDWQPVDGLYTLQQPTIYPMFKTRQWEECLMAWTGTEGSYYDYLMTNWQNNLLEGADWQATLHDGYLSATAEDQAEATPLTTELTALSAELPTAAQNIKNKSGDGFEINFYEKVGVGTGILANNPWLQELPDPITRTTWDNYLTIAAADAKDLGLQNWNEMDGALTGHTATLTVNGQELPDVPVLIQPGQALGTLGLALGFGRSSAGKVADGLGINAYAVKGFENFSAASLSANPDSRHEFASVQIQHTMMGRKIVNETTLDHFLHGPASVDHGKDHGWNQKEKFDTYKGPLAPKSVSLWDDFDHDTGHMWNMSIDLNLCNGCGACIIACHAENNVPVVGKEEIRNYRDMHWLRIDRYYSAAENKEELNERGAGSAEYWDVLETPNESPDVVFQPVMCQHCNHAPCETVCPVAATTHSAEGLNHMAYNRCIGTRYCANNCPYKVRRFNWFLYHDNEEQFGVNYAMNDDLGRMVLNPDVTVRSRGVMEKCSMCIQRIQLGKLEAKKAGSSIKDGDIQTACQSACDTGAIVFGDVNDKDSAVFKLKQNERMYHLLEEIGTQPSVFYQTKVRNRA